MAPLEYGLLSRRGFKIIRENKKRIEIWTPRGTWSYLCDFSEDKWYRMLEDDKTISYEQDANSGTV